MSYNSNLRYLRVNMLLLVILCMCPAHTANMWPLPYKVNLHQEETFTFGSDTIFSEKEQEMIKRADMSGIKLNTINTTAQDYDFSSKKQMFLFYSFGITHDDVRSDATFYDDRKPAHIFKRSTNEDTSEAAEYEYNYETLKKEYEEQIQNEIKSNSVFIYNEEAHEESVQDAVKVIADAKPLRKCSEKQIRFISFRAFGCLLNDYRHSSTALQKFRVLKKMLRIIFIWFLIYCSIALCFWCHKGWCCCCFKLCFLFCRPVELVQQSKKYIANNPPGRLVLADERVINYKPTIYEVEEYERFNSYLRRM